jgi:hypothetical protein
VVERTNRGYGRGGSSFWWFDEGKSRLRFCGFGDLKPRGDGESLEPTLYETEQNTLKEFPVPAKMIEDGKLSVTFERVYLQGVNWRYQPRLAEAWLIKTK